MNNGRTEEGPAVGDLRPLKTEESEGMCIEYDVPIVMEDGVVLRANVYRPLDDEVHPVIASMGAYGKDYPFQDAPYDNLWKQMVENYPDSAEGSSNMHQAWEVVDPEKWVPHGYAVLRIDSRGAARSEGFMNNYAVREAKDYVNCIEWAGVQPWSNGKVGLSGISYYAVNQWRAAEYKPKHLAAICPWEGCVDWYRDAQYQGGIHSSFLGKFFPVQVKWVQHGVGSRGHVNPHSGIQIAGDEDLTDEELAMNRAEPGEDLLEHPFDDDYFRDRSANLPEVSVPLLSAANWGGLGLHNRGNFTGFMEAESTDKYLEVHGREHWTLYYADYGVTLMRRFFDWYLKGEGDWDTQPKVSLNIRRPGERFVLRGESEWPLRRTRWTRAYLDPAVGQLREDVPDSDSTATYQASRGGLDLALAPFDSETEITGPVAAKVFISSSTFDADLFLVLRLFAPDGEEVLFQGGNDPKTPISQGWLRASHRKIDTDKSPPWRPFHPHDEMEPLTPGAIYELDVEIWPTCVVAPAGYQLVLSILGHDFDHGQEAAPSHIGPEMRGSAFFLHDDPRTRPPEIYDNEVTVLGGPDHQSYLLLPIVPEG
jgi:hypothetical protein